jgi:hypothetical protein
VAPKAKKKILCWLALLCATLGGFLAFESPLYCHARQSTQANVVPLADKERVVFLGSNLSDEELITFASGVAASPSGGIALVESPAAAPEVTRFIEAYRPTRVIRLCRPPEKVTAKTDKRGHESDELDWQEPFPERFWQILRLQHHRLVVCRAEPRRLLLQAACLAGVMRAPIYILHGRPEETAAIERILTRRDVKKIYVVGDAQTDCRTLPKSVLSILPDEQSVVSRYLRYQLRNGPIETLVVANPADVHGQEPGTSSWAPWLTLQKHAALALTNEAGRNVGELVERAIGQRELHRLDSILLMADLQGIPSERRPNPAPGKDLAIDMEPLTPSECEPFTFATGRLFHKSPALIPLMLARQHLLANREISEAARPPRKALVISNPAGGLPLLETFSRNTASELRNAGYETKAIFGSDVTAEEVRRLLPQQDVFLWEGHHSTMTRTYGLPNWPEPLRPSLIFLQSCLALCEEDALPLLSRGALAVVGSSSRTYSASGGACSLAFFDSLLYEDQSLGASLRHAKNFLVAYALLKEKRLGEDAKLRGANIRSAWAFSLWGDPTLKMPRPKSDTEGLLSVHHEVRGNVIELHQPAQPYEMVISEQYQTQMLPNARLAGLVQKKGDDSQRQLVPLLFAEVRLPKAPKGAVPRLRTRIPEDHWVFLWDSRRKCGYLLVTPRAKDTGNLRFQVHWEQSGCES